MLKRLFGIRPGPKTRLPRPERRPRSLAFVLGLTALVLSMVFSGGCANSTDSTPVAPPQPTATAAPTALPLPATADPTAAPAATPPPSVVVPTAAPLLAGSIPFVQLAVGLGGRCGLQGDGRIVCRGSNYYLRPPILLAEVPFRQVTVGQEFACGLHSDGTIACWGEAVQHKKTTPPPGQFTAVAAGKQHACALDTAGYAQCWGWDEDGRATPPAGIAFTAIAAGGVHSCGLTAAGQLRCWGKNTRGEADNHAGPFQSLALGLRNTCALRPDGTAWCQGDNANGQSNPPPGEFTQIAAGERRACGLRPGGRVECWGGGFGAELAEPTGNFTALSGSWDTFCAAGHDAAGCVEPRVTIDVFCALTEGGYPLCWHYLPDSPQPAADPVADFAAEMAPAALQWPVELFPWPQGGLAVVEREGLILLCQRRDNNPCAGGPQPPLLDLTDWTDSSTAESGMLSAALDPDFDRHPFLYVYYTVRSDPRKVRLSRFPVADGPVDLAAELIILEVPMPDIWQFGGAIRFGPDGMLYLGIGENRVAEESQDLSSLRGKIIRIDVRNATPEQPYQIPADNPMLTTPGARPEVWAYGLRNPWRMSFDAAGRLWVGDVGSTDAEEVSIVTAGANLGWPAWEGNDRCHWGELRCAALPDYAPPVVSYGREEGCAIIWGGQYQGVALPQRAGDYLFGDYCSGRIWALTPEGESGWARRRVATVGSPLLAFGADAAGEMYALSLNQPPLSLASLLSAGPAAESPVAGP